MRPGDWINWISETYLSVTTGTYRTYLDSTDYRESQHGRFQPLRVYRAYVDSGGCLGSPICDLQGNLLMHAFVCNNDTFEIGLNIAYTARLASGSASRRSVWPDW